MKAPTEEHSKRFNKKRAAPQSVTFEYPSHEISRSLPIVPVVIDPILACRLRPHQIEGRLIFVPRDDQL